MNFELIAGAILAMDSRANFSGNTVFSNNSAFEAGGENGEEKRRFQMEFLECRNS